MNYQTGRIGRCIVAQFDDGDDILGSLMAIVTGENIRAAVVYLLGGVTRGRIVVGPEAEELPPTPVWRELGESHEMVGVGTVFWEGDVPKIHFHGTYGKRDVVRTGCLREKAETFIILEGIILEIEGVNGVREMDPLSGMVLLRLKESPVT